MNGVHCIVLTCAAIALALFVGCNQNTDSDADTDQREAKKPRPPAAQTDAPDTPPVVSGTTYYASSSSGDDSSNGTSAATCTYRTPIRLRCPPICGRFWTTLTPTPGNLGTSQVPGRPRRPGRSGPRRTIGVRRCDGRDLQELLRGTGLPVMQYPDLRDGNDLAPGRDASRGALATA
jgi:hypothetical protein